MLNRPEYKKLVKAVKNQVEEQKKKGLVAITKGFFSILFPPRQLRDYDQSWPRVMKELGLEDDGTGTETWTLKGFGFKDVYADADDIIAEVKKGRG